MSQNKLFIKKSQINHSNSVGYFVIIPKFTRRRDGGYIYVVPKLVIKPLM